MANDPLYILHANRRLHDRDEVRNFDDALASLQTDLTESQISNLYKAFDDQCEQHEVMFGLVHFVEQVDPDAVAFLQVLPEMMRNASDWARILLMRTLNNDTSREPFVKRLAMTHEAQTTAVIELLRKIATKKGKPVGERAKAVLEELGVSQG